MNSSILLCLNTFIVSSMSAQIGLCAHQEDLGIIIQHYIPALRTFNKNEKKNQS